MTEILFTTMDVSRMLQVDKSTVKRWTDEGKLKCFRTPGGHRKFRAEDLYQFMADYNYGVSPVNLYPQFASDEAVIRRIITKKEFNVLASVCFSAAIKGRKDEVVKLFSETYRYGLSLPSIFDDVLRPTIKRINDLYASNKISAAEKELAHSAISNSIVLLSDIVAKSAPNGKKAICATVERDINDIELKSLVVLLESEGFDVLNLGVSASTDSIAQLAKDHLAQYVFLAASAMVDRASCANEHTKIMEELKSYGGKLIIIGQAYTQELLDHEFQGLFDKACSSFKELASVHHEMTSGKTHTSPIDRN
jgi:MerR family transcriptional regulator, light-induced transcriptional regulator